MATSYLAGATDHGAFLKQETYEEPTIVAAARLVCATTNLRFPGYAEVSAALRDSGY